MMWLKQCPKCDGDLSEGVDIYGRFVACLQCAYELCDSEERQIRLLGRILAPARVRVAVPVESQREVATAA